MEIPNTFLSIFTAGTIVRKAEYFVLSSSCVHVYCFLCTVYDSSVIIILSSDYIKMVIERILDTEHSAGILEREEYKFKWRL